MNVISDKELEELLGQSPAPRITEDDIKSRIVGYQFTAMKDVAHPNDNATICTIYLDNGYSVRGESVCVNPENYKREIGEKIAYENAFDKLWPIFGFLLAEIQYQKAKAGKA